MVIEPEKPLFLISIRTRQARTAVKVSEIASLEDRDRNAYINITEESYAPALLALLWKRFGRERIEQLTRLEILCHGIPMADVEGLELDPGQELKKELLDAVWRLMPEGFKVHHNILTETVMTVVATEHEMKQEFIAAAEKMHQDMEAASNV